MHKIIKQTILNYFQATYTIAYEMESTFRFGSHSQHCIYANIKGFKRLSFKAQSILDKGQETCDD